MISSPLKHPKKKPKTIQMPIFGLPGTQSAPKGQPEASKEPHRGPVRAHLSRLSQAICNKLTNLLSH